MDLLLRAQALFPVLKVLKDDLHRHPELSGREVRTTALLKQKLSALPVELVDLGVPTGTAALLRGGAFKPRTSPYAFQGMGNDGIRLLQKFSAAQSKKPCIARARADKVDFPQRRQCRLSR